MTRVRLFVTLCLLCLLPACAAPREPVGGCVLAAANRREVLRARGYLDPAIPARILAVHQAGAPCSHAALIYRLDRGWCAYDDTFLSRSLRLGNSRALPAPFPAARAAFRGWSVDAADWLD